MLSFCNSTFRMPTTTETTRLEHPFQRVLVAAVRVARWSGWIVKLLYEYGLLTWWRPPELVVYKISNYTNSAYGKSRSLPDRAPAQETSSLWRALAAQPQVCCCHLRSARSLRSFQWINPLGYQQQIICSPRHVEDEQTRRSHFSSVMKWEYYHFYDSEPWLNVAHQSCSVVLSHSWRV